MGDKDSFTKISCGIPKEFQQKKKLFLFRFPKDFDIKQLENVSMTLPVKDESLNMKIGESDYRIQLDEDRLFSTIRPLISNENRTTVGEPFAASFTMSRRIALKTQDDSPPITFYSKVPQFEGLAVRHMPFGSTTNLEDLRSRTLETPKSRVRERESGEPVLNKEKHKKRKSEIKTEPAATAPIATEILETPSKPKKSKKNKKSQE